MIKSFISLAVSNKAFTNQMLGQQLLIILSKELWQELKGYYTYHKLTVFSTDSHLNHQIFIHKAQLIQTLITRVKQLFGIDITIKNIMTIARSVSDVDETTSDADVWEVNIGDRYDGEDF